MASSSSLYASGDSEFVGFASHGKGHDLKSFSYVPRPLGVRDVQLEISHCGICHSDIHTIDSGWGPTLYPVVPGHEIVGIVSRVGANVQKFKIGDRAAIGAQVLSCGKCESCLGGNGQFCSSRVFTYNAKYEDGGVAYGGYQNAIRCDETYVFHVPDSLTNEEAAPLLCAGITTYRPLKHSITRPGMKVGIVGLGGLGHLAVQYARALGAASVAVISTSDNKKSDAHLLGANEFIVSTDPAQIQKHSDTLDLILCCGVGDTVDVLPYFALLKLDGEFSLVAAPEKPLSIPASAFIFKRIKFTGSLIGSAEEVQDMLNFSAKHQIKPMIEVMPMDQVNEALLKVRHGDVRYRIVLQNHEHNHNHQ